jgi:hypothetical protein
MKPSEGWGKGGMMSSRPCTVAQGVYLGIERWCFGAGLEKYGLRSGLWSLCLEKFCLIC